MDHICQSCHQAKATVQITDMVPEKKERFLCEECAQKERVIIKPHQPTAAIIQELIKQKAGLATVDDVSCPKCGASFREFQLKGLLGCANDYEAFRSMLAPLIERAHEGATHHVGKTPGPVDVTTRKQVGLQRLRRELHEAIEHENYELAARVRDQIRVMESA